MQQTTTNPSTVEVQWNLSAALIIELQKRLDEATTNYIKGELTKAFYALKATKMRVIHSLDKDERKSMTELEAKIAVVLSRQIKKPTEARNLVLENILAYYYEKYNEKLLDLMEKYGYLIQKKQDSSRMF